MIETKSVVASDGAASGARCTGSRGPHVLFLHGVGSTAAIWDRQLEALGDAFRCTAIELRGNGVAHPEPDAGSITREGYVRDALAVAHAVDAQRFHIVGCSLGGVVAFELWRAVPQRIASITFVASFAAYPNSLQTVGNITAAVMEAPDLRAFAQTRTARLLPPDAPPQRRSETIDQMACKTLQSYIAATQATWTGDYRSLLSSITAPVLVVCGGLDLIAPPALSHEIASGIAGAQLLCIERAAHVVNADEPAAFNAALRSFLEGAREPAG